MANLQNETNVSNKNALTDSPFQSFWMGGFECSTQRLAMHEARGALAGQRRDMISATRHDVFARQDYKRLQTMGMCTARDGVRWHLIEPTPHRYDFSSLLPMLRAARDTNTQIIWDLFHYGWPDDLDIWSAAFVDRFARFAWRTAQVILEEMGSPICVTPVNEISFVAWGGGDVEYLNPFACGRGGELKIQLVRAAIAAIEAVREVDAAARICHAEPIIHIAAEPEFPNEVAEAEAHRLGQYEAWDMISGRTFPELGGRAEHLDVLGVNYYANNQWLHRDPRRETTDPPPNRTLASSHPMHRPLREMLGDVHARYGLPLFIAETGIEDDARRTWLRYVGQEARAAIATGIPLHGLCLYPIVNHPGWDDDRHCHNGLWDYANDGGERPMYSPLAEELRHQQSLLDDFHRTGVFPTVEFVDTAVLDEAAQHAEDADTQSRGPAE